MGRGVGGVKGGGEGGWGWGRGAGGRGAPNPQVFNFSQFSLGVARSVFEPDYGFVVLWCGHRPLPQAAWPSCQSGACELPPPIRSADHF